MGVNFSQENITPGVLFFPGNYYPGSNFFRGVIIYGCTGRWGLNISSSLRTRVLSIFRMVVIQIILNLSKFTSRRNWAPTGLPYPQIVTPSMGYLRQNNNPFNDIEELEHHTLELWDKCAINLKIIMKAIKQLCWEFVGSCVKRKWFH